MKAILCFFPFEQLFLSQTHTIHYFVQKYDFIIPEYLNKSKPKCLGEIYEIILYLSQAFISQFYFFEEVCFIIISVKNFKIHDIPYLISLHIFLAWTFLTF